MGDLFYYRGQNDTSSMVQDAEKIITSNKVVHISVTKEDRKRAERLKKLREVVWEAFKGIVFIVCFGGFTYQISEFLIHFYTYPTTIDIEIQEPDYVLRPAVTICDTNPVKRSAFCTRFQSDCIHVEDPEKFCVDHPLYCGAELNMSNFYVPGQPFLRFDYTPFLRFRADFLNTYQPTEEVVKIEDSEKRARLEGPFYISCVMHHCYSMNNLAISNQQSKKRDIERNLKIFPSRETTPEKMDAKRAIVAEVFEVLLDETDHYDYFSTPSAFLSVHSPFTLVEPNFDGVVLEPNREYKIHVNLTINAFIYKEEDHKLKSPFKTDCRDYEEEWVKNHRTGPTSQQACIYECLNTFWEECYNRSHPRIFSTITEACSYSEPGLPNRACNFMEERYKLMKTCQSTCRVPCKERKYTIRVQEKPFKDWSTARMMKKATRARIPVEIIIDETKILVYSLAPKYLTIELFSYVGGFLGCWLGLSIWSTSLSMMEAYTYLRNKLKNKEN